MDQLKVGDPMPEGFNPADCGCVHYAEENRLCPNDIEKLEFMRLEMIEDFRQEFIHSDLDMDDDSE